MRPVLKRVNVFTCQMRNYLSRHLPGRVTERDPVDQLRVALGRRDEQGLPEVEAEAANHVTPAIKGQGSLGLLLLPRMSRSRFVSYQW